MDPVRPVSLKLPPNALFVEQAVDPVQPSKREKRFSGDIFDPFKTPTPFPFLTGTRKLKGATIEVVVKCLAAIPLKEPMAM